MAKERKHPVLRKVLLTVAICWALLLFVFQLVMNERFLTAAANKYVSRYVDADVSFGRISASVVRSFPFLNVTVDDLAVTYPHDRFAAWDSTGAPSFLRRAGRGEQADTLVSARGLNASVNYLSLAAGRVRVRHAGIDRPRIFAHRYDSTAANWQIFKASSSRQDDTTQQALPPVTLLAASLTGRPVVVFTDPSDTLFASARLKELSFKGRLEVDNPSSSRIGINVDSLFVAGRLPADTLALSLDRLAVNEHEDHVDFDLDAKAHLALSSLGRMRVPLSLSGELGYPCRDGVQSFWLRNFHARLATVDISAEGEATVYADSTYVKARAQVDRCRLSETFSFLSPNIPSLGHIHTDATLSLDASCDGWYHPTTRRLPPLEARVKIPSSHVSYDGVSEEGTLVLDLVSRSDDAGRLDASLQRLDLGIPGLDLSATGSIRDVLCGDPRIALDADVHAVLSDLVRFLPDSLDVSASGSLDGTMKGSFRPSQLNLYNFSSSDLRADLRSEGIRITAPRYAVDGFLDRTAIRLGPMDASSDGPSPMALSVSVDSLHATLGERTFIRGTRLYMAAHNGEVQGKGKNAHRPFVGYLNLRSIGMMDADSCFVGAFGMKNTFRYDEQPQGKDRLPVVNLKSSNGGLFVRRGVNRFGLRGATLSASARRNAVRDALRRKHMLDSLAKVYPLVPRDSLLFYMMRERMAGRTLPAYMMEKDFQDRDIDIRLGEQLARYFREWTLSGKLDIADGVAITPYFPLRNTLSGAGGTFDNDGLHLKNVTFTSGRSDVSASGSLTGLRRALTSRRAKGFLKLDLKVSSNLLDANELLGAYSAGRKAVPVPAARTEGLSDEEYMATVVTDSLAATDSLSGRLIVIPANLDAKLSLMANEIRYSDLNINWMASDILVKERCLQLTNTLATSNMGDIYFEGFYATRSKNDIAAGFDVTLSDITADKVITLLPVVDTIMPMLQSFKGLLDCEMAVTTRVDTSMNVIMPSLNGIFKVSGTNLELARSEALSSLAKTLMFRSREGNTIDDMSVQGLIGNNRVEVFPFVLNIDRYTLALSGLQHFDQHFNYHASVLRSPVPFRFGVDVTGNFQKWNWRLCKARYKSANVPVFTTEIDNVKYNLVNSIHNIFTRGVEVALEQNRTNGEAVEKYKEEIGYVTEAVTDTLGAGERSVLDSLRREPVLLEGK